MAIYVGRILISINALTISIGAFVADFNETHVLNTRWPPHARFHNGQTMSLGVLLAASSLYYLWRPKPSAIFKASSGNSVGRDSEKDDLFCSALIGSMYTAAGLSAIWYPGTAWTDPEFIAKGDATRPNMWLFGGLLVTVWIGWSLELARLNRSKEREKAQ